MKADEIRLMRDQVNDSISRMKIHEASTDDPTIRFIMITLQNLSNLTLRNYTKTIELEKTLIKYDTRLNKLEGTTES